MTGRPGACIWTLRPFLQPWPPMATPQHCSPRAQGDDARQILKAMTGYVTSQNIILATYDTDIEVITNDLQKIQFVSSGQSSELVIVTNALSATASELKFGGLIDMQCVS